MRVILVLTLLLFVVEFIQCLKRTCVESASNKYVENLFKPLVAVQDRQDFDNNRKKLVNNPFKERFFRDTL